MKHHIVHIAKTDLNTDGRILNELQILTNHFPYLTIDFILLPDKEYRLHLKRINVHSIKCFFRNNKLLRPLTVLEFTVKAVIKLFKRSPTIIHVQDSSVVFPVLVYYSLLRKNKPILIYDDHEIPNNFHAGGILGINLKLEKKLLKIANTVFFANEERMEYLRSFLSLKNRLTYFLNLPYFDKDFGNIELSNDYRNRLSEIDALQSRGVKFIMHQGVIKRERGSKELAEFSKTLPPDYRIMLLGGSYETFQEYIKKYTLSETSFLFVGMVDYFAISEFWNRCVASVVIYLPNRLNNRLCAPNRLYLSVSKNIPVIVNSDNPVLSNFVKRYKCGLFIENVDHQALETLNEMNSSNELLYEELEKEQIANFIKVYDEYLISETVQPSYA